MSLVLANGFLMEDWCTQVLCLSIISVLMRAASF